jgi:hypothetical protein
MDRVSLWVNVRLPSHHRPTNCMHYSNIVRQKAHTPNFPYKTAAFDKSVKELLVKQSDFLTPFEVCAIKPHKITVLGLWSSKCLATASVPAINHLLIKCTDCSLVIRF